jgi:2-oxoglutarate dehydrogenase E1 component
LRNSSLHLEVVSRKESSSTATGYQRQHIAQQIAIIEEAFATSVSREEKKDIKKTTKEAAKVD